VFGFTQIIVAIATAKYDKFLLCKIAQPQARWKKWQLKMWFAIF